MVEGVGGEGSGDRRDREADKVQVKVQGHLSPQSFITRESPRTLKRQTKERKERQEQKKNPITSN